MAAFCLTAASATGAVGPHEPLKVASIDAPKIQDRLPRTPHAPTVALTIPLVAPAASSEAIAERISRETDPLEAVDAVEAAPVIDPRADVIAGMPQPSEPTDLDGPAKVSVMSFGDRKVPRWIVETIVRASEATDADPVYMMALADKESSFIPHNKAGTSSAEGLYQFISSTWLEVMRSFGPKHGYEAEAEAIESVGGQLTVPDSGMREHILGLRQNAYLSAVMAGEMKRRDKVTIEAKLGRAISRSEFYLSHFFGADSARKFMALVDDKPKQSAPRVFPAAAKANKALFYERKGKKTRQLSVAEVYEKIDDMIDTRLSRYEGVTDFAVADATL